MENDQEEWDKHVRAIEIARTLVREEIALWRDELGDTDAGHTAASLAMEMQLYAMSLRAPLSVGGLGTVEFFCELTDVDFSYNMETMNNAISYGHAVVAAEESSAQP